MLVLRGTSLHNKPMPNLYMMFGYPGAGKTTAAEVIAQLTGAAHLQSDKVRLELFPQPTFSQMEHDALYATLDARTEQLLRQGRDVIYDANLNRYQHRRDKYVICEKTGAAPILLWVQTEKTLSKARAMHDSRKHLWPPGETPDKLFDRVADIIEEPGPAEPHIIIDGTAVTPEYISDLLQLEREHT
jgi:predicted kinase